MKCWNCGALAAGTFCEACDALQPPDPVLDHFARLGLERRFEQSVDKIVERHRGRQRRVHPDRFASRSARERRLSLEHATALNDALRTLRDPLKRAEYLLLRRGVDVNAEGEGRVRLGSAFLMEIIELREAIGELVGPDAQVERERIRHQVAGRFEALLGELGAALDSTPRAEPPQVALWAQSAAQLRYLRRVLEELEGEQA